MSLSGLSVEQAKEFHEQFKVTYTAFAGIAAVAHHSGHRLEALVLSNRLPSTERY